MKLLFIAILGFSHFLYSFNGTAIFNVIVRQQAVLSNENHDQVRFEQPIFVDEEYIICPSVEIIHNELRPDYDYLICHYVFDLNGILLSKIDIPAGRLLLSKGILSKDHSFVALAFLDPLDLTNLHYEKVFIFKIDGNEFKQIALLNNVKDFIFYDNNQENKLIYLHGNNFSGYILNKNTIIDSMLLDDEICLKNHKFTNVEFTMFDRRSLLNDIIVAQSKKIYLEIISSNHLKNNLIHHIIEILDGDNASLKSTELGILSAEIGEPKSWASNRNKNVLFYSDNNNDRKIIDICSRNKYDFNYKKAEVFSGKIIYHEDDGYELKNCINNDCKVLFSFEPDFIRDIALSPYDSRLLVFILDKNGDSPQQTVEILDCQTGKILYKLATNIEEEKKNYLFYNNELFTDISFSPSGNKLYMYFEGGIAIWEIGALCDNNTLQKILSPFPAGRKHCGTGSSQVDLLTHDRPPVEEQPVRKKSKQE